MADSSQQTEKATPRHLQKARDKGNFPVAREFVAAVQFTAYVLLAANYFPGWLSKVKLAFQFGLRSAFSGTLSVGDLLGILIGLSNVILRPLAALGVTLLLLAIAMQLASTNLGFSFARLAPQFDRLNPAQRLKQLPANNLTALMQSLLMVPVMIWITWTLVKTHFSDLMRLPFISASGAGAAAGALLVDALRKASYMLVALGVVMLVRDRLRYAKGLRMSKQEIREEAKDTDGNPQTKARVRRIQRDMRRRHMMRDLPTATAVIVNPTHYAVAIRYDQGLMAAPMVVAKGKNYLAARIRQRAIENQVPIIENPPLAQALYKAVEVGQEIPAQLYRAVAEVLAYIFRLVGRAGAGR
jgi:flagellar biosynthesis protein FlhB